ncbi:hypothetical protein [Salmonella enterica]|uniref:hypothetical protein n=1 Tax=Salmonella enterica TaxID=28901 RepID=UPI001D1C828B|nr:hypothetical protein [Salmonella enterica]
MLIIIQSLLIVQSLLFCAALVRVLSVNAIRLCWRWKNRTDTQALAVDTLCTTFPEIDELKPGQGLFIKTVGGLCVFISKNGNLGE